jgi:hypothetical protein
MLMAVSTAIAQAPAPAAPASAPPAAAATAPAATPPRLDMKPPARAPRTTIVDADARNCLEFPSNLEIIKCAEKYLHRRAG